MQPAARASNDRIQKIKEGRCITCNEEGITEKSFSCKAAQHRYEVEGQCEDCQNYFNGDYNEG